MVTSVRQQGGFTYVWVLIAVAVTAGLLAVAMQSATDRARRERQIEYAWIVEQYRLAVQSYAQYEITTGGAPLQSLRQLVRDERGGVVRRHIRQLYPNPMTGRVDWQLRRGPNGEVVGVAPSPDP
jgi:type II secretory pathway pseudopilin PulG